MPRLVEVTGAALERAVGVPSAAVRRHVDGVRRRNPEASPAEVVGVLEQRYLHTVTATGGAVGVAAAVPAVGTGAALALTASNIATYLASSAAFTLAVADVHGIGVEDTDRRLALLLTSVLGADGARAVAEFELTPSGLSGVGPWARLLLTRMPLGTVKAVNRTLTKQFVRDQAAAQGVLALGRIVPFGIGAVVGAAGSRAFGRGVVRNARLAFGEAPSFFVDGPLVIAPAPAPLVDPVTEPPHPELEP